MLFVIFLCFVLSLRVHQSDAALQLDISSSTIELALTKSLTVNCTFTYVSDISNIVSIILSKSNDDNNSTFHELISISSFDPDVLVPSVNVTASGHIDNSGVSYLSLYWTYPTVKEAGLYRCTVNGLDSTGQPKDVSFTGQVTASKPNFDQLIEIVRNQQLMFNQVEKTLATIGDTVNKLVSSVETFMENTGESDAGTEKRLKLLTVDFQKPGEYNGKYYLLSRSQTANFSISQERCEELGGYMAEIEDANENEFIKNLLSIASPIPSSVLFGGRNEANTTQWIWQNSQRPFSFTDWYYQESYNPNVDYCLYMYEGYLWKWLDNQCDMETNFLCEVDL